MTTHGMRILGLAACFLALLPAEGARAATYYSTAQILREFFPGSERITYRKEVLDEARAKRIVERLGYRPAKKEYVIFVATTGGKVDGYAFIDDEKGQHEPITFGVKLSPEAVVERQEVMVYRERYGDEVTDPRFRAQFVGMTSRNSIRAGADVDVVTGATISSRSMAIGVRRAVILLEELLLAQGSEAPKG